MAALSRTAHNWRALGRVREGVTVAEARANLSSIARRIRHQYGIQVDLSDAAVVPLADAIVGDVRTALLTLLGAVGLLLMVAAPMSLDCSWRVPPLARENWQFVRPSVPVTVV
ncbi:hypothetical protein [Edaphobacter modestus]|uniref:hypothetical protein n=1 Tax=Edaphobacter modestus TaxID=388466 RepID=UPI0013EE96BD|nr:hypothetical protein [Edaphobacter modestus]